LYVDTAVSVCHGTGARWTQGRRQLCGRHWR